MSNKIHCSSWRYLCTCSECISWVASMLKLRNICDHLSIIISSRKYPVIHMQWICAWVKHFDPLLERNGSKTNGIKEIQILGECSSVARVWLRWLWAFRNNTWICFVLSCVIVCDITLLHTFHSKFSCIRFNLHFSTLNLNQYVLCTFV